MDRSFKVGFGEGLCARRYTMRSRQMGSMAFNSGDYFGSHRWHSSADDLTLLAAVGNNSEGI